MYIRQLAARELVLVGALLCGSCAEMSTRSPADYVGPKAPEPNVVSAPATATGVVGTETPAQNRPIVPATGPLTITIEQAMLLALENNKSLMVQRLNPQIERTFEQQQLAAFDPDLTAQVAEERDKVTAGPTLRRADGITASAGVDEFLPTGTTLGVTGSSSQVNLAGDEEEYASRVAFNATQSLLRGFGSAVNLASVNQARIDVEISQYELRGFVQTLHRPGGGDVLGLRPGPAAGSRSSSSPWIWRRGNWRRRRNAIQVGDLASRPSSRRPKRKWRCAGRI